MLTPNTYLYAPTSNQCSSACFHIVHRRGLSVIRATFASRIEKNENSWFWQWPNQLWLWISLERLGPFCFFLALIYRTLSPVYNGVGFVILCGENVLPSTFQSQEGVNHDGIQASAQSWDVWVRRLLPKALQRRERLLQTRLWRKPYPLCLLLRRNRRGIRVQ